MDGISSVYLEASSGTDLDIVNCARVSFAKRSNEFGPNEKGLLKFLMKNKHGTPFEHNFYKFKVRAPMIVFWEWVRHRVGVSYNVESARYSEMRPDFFIPIEARTQVGKPGHYTFEPAGNGWTKHFQESLEEWTKYGLHKYLYYINNGIAKEQARLFIPTNVYVEFYFTCNARSLMNFLCLRNSKHAMLEIKLYAEALEEFFKQTMPVTAESFIENGRQAP